MDLPDIHIEEQRDGAIQADTEPIRLMASDCSDLFQRCLDRFSNSTESSVAFAVVHFVREYDGRFDAWSSFLGVFAGKNACLDHRLRHHPALQDMIIRLLDILRRNLYLVTVYEIPDMVLNQSGAVVDESEDHIMTDALPSNFTVALSGIKESIVRLNKLGIAIRSSSRSTATARARRFAAQHPSSIRLSEFETRAYLALTCLYPNAPETLRQQLADAMTDRYAKIQYESYRMMHRDLGSSIAPTPSGEDSKEERSDPGDRPMLSIDNLENGKNIQEEKKAVTFKMPASSIDTHRLRANLGTTSTVDPQSKLPKTLTVHMTRLREPPVPKFEDGKDYTTCEWCFQVIDRSLLHKRQGDCGQNNYTEWSNEGRRHYRQDLQPYVCISESCSESRPTYASSSDWFEHMMSTHPIYWSQDIHDRSAWVCTAEHENDSFYKFSTQDELHNHIILHHEHTTISTKDHDIGNTSNMAGSAGHEDSSFHMVPAHEEPSNRLHRKRTGDFAQTQGTERTFTCPICLFSPRDDSAAYDIPKEEPLVAVLTDEGSQKAGKRVKLLNQSTPKAADKTTTSWSLGSHIAEHLHHLMIISLQLMSILDTPSDGDNNDDWSTSAATSSDASDPLNDRQDAKFRDLSLEFQGSLTWSDDEDLRSNSSQERSGPKASELVPERPPSVGSDILNWNELLASPARGQSTAAMASDSELKEILRGGRVECPRGSQLFIVPRCVQESTITEPTVKRAIKAGNPDITDAEVDEYTKKICASARQLFATLVFTKKGKEICRLLSEGVTDEDLPLQRKFDNVENDSQWLLLRRSGKQIITMDRWTPQSREKFSAAQRLMTSPVFENGEHYELESSIILPFISFKHDEGKELEFRGGGYSEVLIKCIHQSHHSFWERSTPMENCLVAIKRLISPDENEFRKEESILRRLGPKNHPNLIQLLATYRQEKKWHLIFPYADANLLKYWEHIAPSPNFDETVLWSLKQLYGIADGLQLIHIFAVTIPLSVDGPGQVRVQGNARMSVEEGEEWYGRHGDIKPENILWFKDDLKLKDKNGVLKIADFGLGRFHGRESRSRVNPNTVFSSLTYEPPELQLGTPVSRAYDFWSLGCLYLEFISWLLGGWEAVVEFADRRAIDVAPDFSDDDFFSITNRAEDPKGEIRDGVTDWAKGLHEHERCSALIHDLIRLIMEKMLVIDSKKRIEAADLKMRMREFVDKAEEDEKYLLEPKPWLKTTLPQPDKPKKNLSVKFLDLDTTIPPATWST